MYTVTSRGVSMKKKDERIYKVFKTHNGFARTKDILAAGIHPRNIKRINQYFSNFQSRFY